jgi:predicted RNA-binding Zn-ribbon protein involved in translation (DUF1610 family)
MTATVFQISDARPMSDRVAAAYFLSDPARGRRAACAEMGICPVCWEQIDACRPATHQICPRCGDRTMNPTTERNALSREDNETFVCPDCGAREALGLA